jgi:hypothetical protein
MVMVMIVMMAVTMVMIVFFGVASAGGAHKLPPF